MGHHKTTHICDKKCMSALFYTAQRDFGQKCITHEKTFMKMNELKKLNETFLNLFYVILELLPAAALGCFAFIWRSGFHIFYIFPPLIL